MPCRNFVRFDSVTSQFETYEVVQSASRRTTFASAFDSGLADRKSDFKRSNGNKRATSFPNLVNFRPTISEFSLLKLAIFAAIRLQFADDLHAPRWRFQTNWKIATFNSSRVIGYISVQLVEI